MQESLDRSEAEQLRIDGVLSSLAARLLPVLPLVVPRHGILCACPLAWAAGAALISHTRHAPVHASTQASSACTALSTHSPVLLSQLSNRPKAAHRCTRTKCCKDATASSKALREAATPSTTGVAVASSRTPSGSTRCHNMGPSAAAPVPASARHGRRRLLSAAAEPCAEGAVQRRLGCLRCFRHGGQQHGRRRCGHRRPCCRTCHALAAPLLLLLLLLLLLHVWARGSASSPSCLTRGATCAWLSLGRAWRGA